MYFQRLRDLREDADLPQRRIAELLGTSQKQYSMWETGVREIPARHIITLAQFYKTSADYILGLSNKR